jgi:sugar-specific transcriptional regulator TrmB
MLTNQLTQLGFHKNEIKVYLALFELGQSKAGDIIQHTKLHRNLVYTALEELAVKNLISKMERGGVAVFEINDPKILQELAEQKLDTAKNVIEKLPVASDQSYHISEMLLNDENIEGTQRYKDFDFRLFRPIEQCIRPNKNYLK